MGGPHVGLACEAFDLIGRSFYPLTGSIVTVRYNPPRVNPTRGAPLGSSRSGVLQQWYPLFG